MARRALAWAAALVVALVVFSGVHEAQAKTVYVGGRFAYNPWGKLALKKWRCPVLEPRDQLVFKWKRMASLVQFPLSKWTDSPNADLSTYAGVKDFYNCKSGASTATELKAASDSGEYTYKIGDAEWGSLFFASGVDGQCGKGVRLQTPWIRCFHQPSPLEHLCKPYV